jgi:bla regulator protein blaR1
MLVYLLKSAACLAILLAFYTFFMEKENMHTLKRFYLLGALVAALTIPFVTFVEYVEIVPTELAIMEVIEIPAVTGYVQEQTPIDYLPIILWGVYLLGALLYGFKFVRNLAVIIQRIRKNPKYRVHHIYNVLLSESVVPHTFLSYIFLNKHKFEARQIPKEVLLHEETHAKQKHSWDVLFIEFLQIIFWFNPLIHLAKKAIKLNHEFLADRAVLDQGIASASYQNTLLEFSSSSLHPQLANAINYSSIKKRFTVMKTQTSKKTILLRSLLLLPLLALLLYSFSNAKIIQIQKTETHTSKEGLDSSQTGHTKKETTAREALQTSASLIQNDSLKFIKDWYITIGEKKYYYLRDANRVWHYYDSTKKEVKLDIVAEYKKKYNEYNTLKNSGTHYIHKSKNEQMLLDVLFSDLGGMYFRMSRANRPEIKQSISPYAPYMKFVKNGQTVFKKSNELTEEDKNLIPPPPPTDTVIIYNRLVKTIKTIPRNRNANFIYLRKIHSNMNAVQKNKVEHPDVIAESIFQEGANREQVEEYNKIIRKINEKPESRRIYKRTEVDRITYIYSLMTEKQKKKAEPFLNFPPPPSSPKVTKQIKSNIPPPLPPIKPPTDRNKYSDELLDAFDKLMEEGNLYGQAGSAYSKKGKGSVKDLQQKYEEVMKLYEHYVKLAVKENLMAPTYSKPRKIRKGDKSNIPPPPPPYAVPKDGKKYSDELFEAFDKFNEKGNTYGNAMTAYMKNGKGTTNKLNNMYMEVMVLYDNYVELAVKENLMAPRP